MPDGALVSVMDDDQFVRESLPELMRTDPLLAALGRAVATK
jgi:FixJ family two-component response regulator